MFQPSALQFSPDPTPTDRSDNAAGPDLDWLAHSGLIIDPAERLAAVRLQDAIDGTLAAWGTLPITAIALDAQPDGVEVTCFGPPGAMSAHESMRKTVMIDRFDGQLRAILSAHPGLLHPDGVNRIAWSPGKPTTVEYAGRPRRTNTFELRGGRTIAECLPIGAAMRRARIAPPKGASRTTKPLWDISLRSGSYDTDIHYGARCDDINTAARHLLGLTAIQLALGDVGRIIIHRFGPDRVPLGNHPSTLFGAAAAVNALRHRPSALDRLILSLLDPQHLAP